MRDRKTTTRNPQLCSVTRLVRLGLADNDDGSFKWCHYANNDGNGCATAREVNYTTMKENLKRRGVTGDRVRDEGTKKIDDKFIILLNLEQKLQLEKTKRGRSGNDFLMASYS